MRRLTPIEGLMPDPTNLPEGCPFGPRCRCVSILRGEILYDGRDIAKMSSGQMREMRKKMQIVFQDPYSSLDPRMTIGASIRRPLDVHGLYERREPGYYSGPADGRFGEATRKAFTGYCGVENYEERICEGDFFDQVVLDKLLG